MGKFNLSNPTDFARAVTSGPADVLSLFTGRGASAWDIQEGAFYRGDDPATGVVFHVFQSATDYQGALSQVADRGGRRKAKFLFPYVDGQLTEDLGRTPNSFNLDIILHGNHYFNAFVRLMQLLNDPRPGTLVHPILGNVTCAMESFEILHKSDSRKAVAITLTMIEHSFTGVQLTTKEDKSAPSKIQNLLKSFQKIDNAISKVEAFIFAARTLKNTIVATLETYKEAFAKVSNGLNITFNRDQQIPGLLPVNEGGLVNDNGSFAGNAISSSASPSDPFQSLPAELTNTTISQAIAVEQLAKDVQSTRDTLQEAITQMEEAGNGQGALDAYAEIQALKQTAIDLQDAYEAGRQSSIIKIINYTVPRLMSIREVAFANNVAVDRIEEIYLLNPELPSVNYIEKGTLMKVVISQ